MHQSYSLNSESVRVWCGYAGRLFTELGNFPGLVWVWWPNSEIFRVLCGCDGYTMFCTKMKTYSFSEFGLFSEFSSRLNSANICPVFFAEFNRCRQKIYFFGIAFCMFALLDKDLSCDDGCDRYRGAWNWAKRNGKRNPQNPGRPKFVWPCPIYF